MAFTFSDLGGCGCGCPCVPCTLPATNLHLAYVNTAGAGHTDSCVLTYGIGGACAWQGTLSGAGAATVTMGCSGTCSYFINALFAGGGDYWDSPAHCSGSGLTRIAAPTANCSPLNLVFVNGTVSWTITL